MAERHHYKLPGKTLAESLGIDTTGAPGGQRIAPPQRQVTKRFSYESDTDQNWSPEPHYE